MGHGAGKPLEQFQTGESPFSSVFRDSAKYQIRPPEWPYLLPLSNQPTVRTGCFQFSQKSYPIYIDKYRFSVPKRQLPIQADLIINRLRWEAMVDRQLDAFDVDDDAPHVPSADPMSNPQSRRKPVHVS